MPMKVKTILSAFSLIISCSLYAQKQGQALIDSMLRELPMSKKDTGKVMLLNLIGRNYVGINPDEAFRYCNEALLLANQLKWTKGKALAYYNLGVANSGISNYPESQADYSTSLALYKTINDTKGVADNYNGFAILNIYQGNFPAAISYLDTCIRIRAAIGDKKGEADCSNNLGSIYQYRGNLPMALYCYNASLQIFIQLNDKERTGAAYNNIGTVYRLQGNYLQALEYHLKALKVDAILKKTSNLITDNGNIANIYLEQKNYAEALKYNHAAIELAQKINDTASVAILSNNIGDVYYQQNNYPLALNDYSTALKMGTEIGNNNVVANAYSKIGQVYANQNKFPEALQSYDKGLIMFREIGDSIRIANTYSNMAVVYFAQKRFPKAEKYYTLALQISRQLGEISVQRSTHEGFSNLYAATGRPDKALYHYKQYIVLKDSSENIDNVRKITQLQNKFDFDLKSDSIKLDTEKRFAIADEKNKTKIRTGLVGGVSFILLLLGGFYFYRKREHDQNKLQQMQLKQDALKARLDTHFVNASLEIINVFIENGDKEAASNYLLKFSRLIRHVLDNSFETNVTLKTDIEFLNDYFQLVKLQYVENHIHYELTIDEAIDPGNTLVPPMIFQVLVENALRHAFNDGQGGTLQVKVKKQGDILQCSVEDNGIGRKAARSLQNGERTSHGTGIAEKLMKVWRPNSQSKFTIEDLTDTEGKPAGTRATFTFPFTTY